ncbi:MAG TPA: hypothetical protein PLO65_13995 [Caulobacter sp.]|nr:hypothetical protein [Caulobacter sp.]
MVKKSGAAGLLAGLAEMLAAGLLEDLTVLAALPRPETDIALERRVRLRGVIARAGLSIHKLQAQEDHPGAPQDQDEADMDEQPDDPDALERKYVELQDRLDRYARRAGLRACPDADSAEGPGGREGQLADASERRPTAAEGPVAHLAAARRPGVGQDLGRRRLAG